MEITEPKTPEEFQKYFYLRWEILRKPWGKPLGSEQDEKESESIHIMVSHSSSEIIGVCRLQLNSEKEAQIRYMAVNERFQRKGIGSKIIDYAERVAIKKGAKTVVLDARESAMNFYEKKGYIIKEKGHLLWNEIQHYKMEKPL